MIIKKNVTVLIPSELLYAFDPDCEHEFLLSKDRDLIVARPVVEAEADMLPCESQRCYTCHNYNGDFDICKVRNAQGGRL